VKAREVQVELTLTLSKDLSEKVQHAAKRRHQDVIDVVEMLLGQALAADDENAVVDLTEPDEIVAQEITAYHTLHAFLWQKYPKHFVAIQGGQLIDQDPDKVALSRRVRAKLPNQFVLIRQVEAEPERTLYFRSPRLSEE
jgi:hypothetical protein